MARQAENRNYEAGKLEGWQAGRLGKRDVKIGKVGLLQLLYDSGARATEIATLNLDYFNARNKTRAILGKGNRFRQIELETKTVKLLNIYIAKYRFKAKPAYQHRLFFNQCGKHLTRHGIYRLCKKYLQMALPPKRLAEIHNPAGVLVAYT
jgi:site-specific recombinase XerD